MSGVLHFFMLTFFWHGYNFKSVSYCTDLCDGKPIHTLCTYPTPGPSAQCSGWTDAPLSDMEKQRLLNKLNQRRDEVAAGRSRRVPPAANMLNLHWVEELADSAQRWADQCIAHTVPDTKDQCRDLLTMTAGQTIATVIGASSGLTATVMADMWYMAGLHYDGNVSSYIPPQRQQKDYTSFTQMVWATTFMVGCGRVRFMGRHGNRMQQLERLVCDWAPGGNVEGARVFAAGTPGSSCPTGATRGHRMSHLCVYQNETLQELLNKLKPDAAEEEYESTSLPITSTVIENIVDALTNSTTQRHNDTKSIDFNFLSGIQDSMQAFKDEILGLVNSPEVNEDTNITTMKPAEGLRRKVTTDELLDLGFDIVLTSEEPRQLVTKATQVLITERVNASGNFGDILNNVLNVNASDILELFAEPVSVPSSLSPKEVPKTNEDEYDDDENLKGWTGAELIPTEGPDADDVTEFGEENTKSHISNKSTTNSDEELASSQDYNLLAIFTDKDSYYEDYQSNSKRDDEDIYYDDNADALKKSFNPSNDRPRLQGKFKSKRDKNNHSEKLSSGMRQRKKSRKKEKNDSTDNIPKKVEDAVDSLLKVLDGAFDAATNQSTTAKHVKKHKHSRHKGQTQKPNKKNVNKQHHSESEADDGEYDDAKELDYYHDLLKEKGAGIKQNVPETSASSATQKKSFTESIDEVLTEQSVIMTTASDTQSEIFEDDGIVTYEPSHKTEAKVIDKDDMLYYDDGANIATTKKKNILKKMSRTKNRHSRLKGRTKTPVSKVFATPAPTEPKMLIPNQYAEGQGVTFFSPPPEPLGEQEEPEFPQFFGPNSTIESIPNAAKSLLRLFNEDIQKDNFPVSDVDLDSKATDYESSMPKRQQSKFFDDPEDMVDGNVFIRRRTDQELDERASFNEALEKVNSTDVLELFQSLRGSPSEIPPELRRKSKKNRHKGNFQNNLGNKASRSRKSHKNKGNKSNRRRTKHVKRNKSRRSFPDSQLFGRKRDGKDVFYDYSVENLNAKHANGSDFEIYHDTIQYTDEDVVKNSSTTLYGSRARDNKTTRFPIQVRMNEDNKLVNQTSPANMLFDEMSQDPGDKLANLVARRHANATFMSEGQYTANRASLVNVSQALVSSGSRLYMKTTLYFMFLVFVSLIK